MITFGYILIGIGIIGILYNFSIYNLILIFWAKLKGKMPAKDMNFKPEITLIIAAHNEELLIEDCVRSIFRSDYPLDKIKIIIGSDGSTDSTVEICRKLTSEFPSISVYDLPRSGKNMTLNTLTPMVDNDFICFMDADIALSPNTISTIISNFADFEVGAAISPMVYSENPDGTNAGHEGEKLYQSRESETKYLESKIYSTVNSLGAFYCVRASLYRPLPNDKVCDDFTPLLDVNLARKRVIYDTDTHVIEFRKKSLGNELNRRARVTSGGLESMYHAKELFSFRYFRSFYFLLSHKICRYLTPFFLIFIIFGTVINVGQNIFYDILLYLETAFALIVLIGYGLEKINVRFAATQFAVYFYAMNYGILKAITIFFRNQTNSEW